MGRRFSRFHRFRVFKTLMGLEPFEVGFFVREKVTKIDLALKVVIKNHSKLVCRLSVMFLTITRKNILFVKSPMGTLLDWKFFKHKKKISFDIDPKEAPISKFASLRWKTFLYDSLETRELLWVESHMGIQLFEVHFGAIFLSSRESIEIGYKSDSI